MKRAPAFAAALLSACTLGAPASGSATLAAQEAAVEFLSKQTTAVACVHVATAPGEMVDGMVQKHLEDPPVTVLERLRKKGVSVQPFSKCEVGLDSIVIAVGWPTFTADRAEVRADWLCGPACGNGYEVHVVKGASGWRGVGARMTWVS